jgi:hypothetical protein
MLAIVFFMTNMVGQNFCNAQDKLKPENCSYFQTVDLKSGQIAECIWLGSDRKTKNNKWIILYEEDVLTLVETSRDEWSINFKLITKEGDFEIVADFFKKQLLANGKIGFGIQNQKEEYDYSKLGGDYIEK